VTNGEIVIAGLLVFLAYKDRLATIWAQVRKHTVWKAVNAYKRKRYIEKKRTNGG